MRRRSALLRVASMQEKQAREFGSLERAEPTAAALRVDGPDTRPVRPTAIEAEPTRPPLELFRELRSLDVDTEPSEVLTQRSTSSGIS